MRLFFLIGLFVLVLALQTVILTEAFGSQGANAQMHSTSGKVGFVKAARRF
jgi:hypothetical protein